VSTSLHEGPIKYKLTERDITARTGIPVTCPVRVFTLATLGIDVDAFIAALSPSFRRLSWDMYDVMREQVHLLVRALPDDAQWLLQDFLPRYYKGDTTLRECLRLFRKLTNEQKREFEEIRSYRQRSVACFALSREERMPLWNEGEWHIEHEEMTGFEQDVPEGDVRCLERIFDPACLTLITHELFQQLLVGVAEMVEDVDPDVAEISMTFHQMRQVARPGEPSAMAPEGIHKDGVHYIVSALVVEREGLTEKSGKSIIYGPDGETEYLRVVLGVGEGLFQADQHSTLYHNVTPCHVASDELVDDAGYAREGARGIFGFDIMVTKRFTA